jgi:hypothetical protein
MRDRVGQIAEGTSFPPAEWKEKRMWSGLALLRRSR